MDVFTVAQWEMIRPTGTGIVSSKDNVFRGADHAVCIKAGDGLQEGCLGCDCVPSRGQLSCTKFELPELSGSRNTGLSLEKLGI